jgi:hypothetical protein
MVTLAVRPEQIVLKPPNAAGRGEYAVCDSVLIGWSAQNICRSNINDDYPNRADGLYAAGPLSYI